MRIRRCRTTAMLAGVALSLMAVATVRASGESALQNELDAAARAYDTAAATEVLSRVRSLYRAASTTELAELHARSSLAVAELLTVELEWLPKGNPTTRRTLGQRIDATAGEGLEVVSTLPESSERWRLRADLIATLIRSDYRAKKNEKDFKEAVARALEIDDHNARAWVAAAKPYLFAPQNRGRDLDEAARLLTHALELDPDLESARLLRALAHDELGNGDAAESDWKAALARNPDCTPALRALNGTR